MIKNVKLLTSLQKQKKKFLTIWSIFILFVAIILTMHYQLVSDHFYFWTLLLTQVAFLLTVFFLKFRLFFPKKEKSIEDNNQSK